jgi:hypothetical protein
MLVMQFATRYAQFCYLCEISYSFENLLAFVKYEPCSFSVDSYEILLYESDMARTKYVIDRRRDHSNMSAVGITRFVRLLVDWLHIILNDYNSINVATNKAFTQNRDQMIVVVFVIV